MNRGSAWTLLCLTLVAAAPADRPVVPSTAVGPRDRPTLIDPKQPAFVPSFAKIDNPPAGRFAERQYAYRYTFPGPFLYGYRGYGSFGWAYGYSGLGGSGYGGSFGVTPFSIR